MNQKTFHPPPLKQIKPSKSGYGICHSSNIYNKHTSAIDNPQNKTLFMRGSRIFLREGVSAMDTELHLLLGYSFGTLILCKIRI